MPPRKTAQKNTGGKKRCRKVAGKKPGKTSWVHGTRLVFFAKRSNEWIKAQEEEGPEAVSKFYTDVTNLYFQKYPYDMGDDEDLEEDTEDPTDPNAIDPEAAGLSQEEAQRRSNIFDHVRGRIGQWYRRIYGGGVDESDKDRFRSMLGPIAERAVGAKPARKQAWQYYSKLHYDTRVKATYDKAWAVEVKRAQDLDQAPPKEVVLRGKITRQMWKDETPEIRREVLERLEKEYQLVLRAWELGHGDDATRSNEQRAESLRNAGFYLQPVAEAASEHFGMNVAILLCGPVGERGGAIEMRSVNAGVSRGLNPKKWHQSDPAGFREVEKSMIKFATMCFSAEECLDRAVDPQDGAPVASGSGSSSEGRDPPPQDGTAGPRQEGEWSGDDTVMVQAPPALPSPPPPPPPQSPSPRSPSPRPTHQAWNRNDMRQWSAELRNAHTAFLIGEKWGEEWADVVNRFLDFEAACGYVENGPRIGGRDRPDEVGDWLKEGRKWHAPALIEDVGALGAEGTFVDRWWSWWRSIQPSERKWIGEGMTCPAGMKWGKLAGLCGRNGFLQVMVSLLWWGMAVVGKPGESGWSSAVGDVDFVLGSLLESGQAKSAEAKKKGRGEKRKRGEQEDEDDEDAEQPEKAPGKKRRSACAKEVAQPEPRTTRSTAGASARPKPKPLGKKK